VSQQIGEGSGSPDAALLESAASGDTAGVSSAVSAGGALEAVAGDHLEIARSAITW
jgi:hypothetical protein